MNLERKTGHNGENYALTSFERQRWSMIIGTCIYDLHLYGTQSLKDKRRILKSIIDRVKNKFNVGAMQCWALRW
jgi:hypothetical protein